MLRYTIPTRVRAVEKLRQVVRGHRTGPRPEDVVLVEEDIGWFVLMEGSHEHLYLGQEQPELRPGDVVRIIIERSSDDV